MSEADVRFRGTKLHTCGFKHITPVSAIPVINFVTKL